MRPSYNMRYKHIIIQGPLTSIRAVEQSEVIVRFSKHVIQACHIASGWALGIFKVMRKINVCHNFLHLAFAIVSAKVMSR